MNDQTIDIIIRLVNGVGFPIAVAAFVLIRMENTLNKLTDAVTKQTELLMSILTEREKTNG